MNLSQASMAATNRTATRIESDTETVKRMTERVGDMTNRIISHSRALGYYEPSTGEKALSAPTPVVATLADAIRELDRALDYCSGSLNVFD